MAAKTAVRYMANRGAMPMSIDYIHASSVDEQLIDYSQIALGEEDPVMIESSQDETVEMEVPNAEAERAEPVAVGEHPKRRGRPPRATQPSPTNEGVPPAEASRPVPSEKPAPVREAVGADPEEDRDIGSDIVAQKVNMVWGDVNESRNQKEVENLLKFYADTLDEISGRDAEGYERLMQNIADHKLTLPLR
jgi:hypothetical protein